MPVAYLRTLAAEDLKRIHQAALEILEQTGMLIHHAGLLELLEGAGARVDHQKQIARFPPDLVEAQLALVPRSMAFRGRTPEFDFTCTPDGDVYSQVGGGSTGYIDLDTGQHRQADTADLIAFAMLGDALPDIHVQAALFCSDVPAATSDLHCLRILLEHQRLPVSTNAFTAANLRAMVEMLTVLHGSREELAQRCPMHLELSPFSPLFLGQDDGEQLVLACDHAIPVLFPVMPNNGATGPITLAGTIAQAVAEWLAMVTLAQLLSPGLPVAYFIGPVIPDMRTLAVQFASPEAGLQMATITQLGVELYGLPVQGNGLCTDGFSYTQTQFQKAQNMMFLCLAGGKIMIGAGDVESVLTCDPLQLVIDDEIMRIARRWVRPIEVSDDTLALDLIDRVGPRGHFLDADHTIAHLRAGELMRTELFERVSRETWLGGGAKTLEREAREKARAILASHEVPPLAREVSRELRRIVAAANMEVGNT